MSVTGCSAGADRPRGGRGVADAIVFGNTERISTETLGGLLELPLRQ